ncbi:MAG TPA: AAA domain-containing protein, partial [Polyangiaceae bacterium]|nr:AAA domain-containing protein [Polyangiaceae bacterium]
LWAHSDAEEADAFDRVVRAILDAWNSNPAMHVYHYASYEPSALKRLMGRYASHEADIDRMLRAGLFVDLYEVVRHGVRASVEGYSIKDLEPLYGFAREVGLRNAGANRRVVERALELGAPDAITTEVRLAVEGYNRDDCLSARDLRDWLETLRTQAENLGALPRPFATDGAAPEGVTDRARRICPLIHALTVDLPLERAERSDEQQARWLLAKLLEWHNRENKAVWWDLYRLRDLPAEELLDEPAILTGLEFVERVEQTKRGIPTDRYVFPPQEFELRDKDVHLRDEKATDFGTVVAFDRAARTIDIRKRGAHADHHPQVVFLHSFVRTDVLEDAIERVAEDVVRLGINDGTGYRAARALLLRELPRLSARPFQQRDGASPVAFAEHVVADLDETVLAIQGPPGAGKTFTGARMICELVRHGKRVGVTAVSHKVIRHLLDAVVGAASEQNLALSCIQKTSEQVGAQTAVVELTSNEEVLARLRAGGPVVVGATAWLWARADARDAVDVLFVDEAGQIALANVLAISHAAKNLVLLGDPQQLEQPQRGSHPEGTGLSVLEHILQEHQTMPSDRGIFLATTWRLPPAVCAFTSELFYEGRLGAEAGCAHQRLDGVAPFNGSGLWIAPVTHDGNRSSSVEEADVVEGIVAALLRPHGTWVDHNGNANSITPKDILVVAPYNAHVTVLTERLASLGVRVGTVDKFQGQEAPVVIYSMATSSPEDAPRGMEFLYSLNRLNVATSRSRCVCILVACPRLFEPDCRTPHQMRLANALCRYVESARRAEPRP